MKLDKAQREKVLALVAAGLTTGEINTRLAGENPPIVCSRQQIDKYRKSRGTKIKEIVEKSERSALKKGLALKENRVKKLQKLADAMEKDLFIRKRLWVKDKKVLNFAGSSKETSKGKKKKREPGYKILDIEEFNEGEVRQYRAVIDDIAQEMGGRAEKIEADIGIHYSFKKAGPPPKR